MELQSDTVIFIGSAHVFLNLTALISKDIKIEELLLKNGYISHENQPESNQKPSFLFPLAFLDMDSKINDISTYFSKNQENINIGLENFQTPYFKQLDAHLVLSTRTSGLSAQITIKHPAIDNEIIMDRIPADKVNIHSMQAKQIRIDVSIQDNGMAEGQFSIDEPMLLPGDKSSTALFSDQLNGTFTVSGSRADIHLTPSFLTYPEGTVSIDFSYAGDKTSIIFTGDMININQARKAGLDILPGSKVCTELFKILLGGTAEKVEVSFHGRSFDDLFNGRNLGLTGTVQNGTARIPQTPLVVRDIDADAAVKDGVLYINPRTGMINDSSIQNGTLAVDLIHYNDHPFKGQFELDVDLSSLPPILISLLPGTTLSNELEQIESLQGTAGVDLSLSLESGQKQVNVVVVADDITGTGIYSRIPGPIVVDAAQFEYRNNMAVIKNFTGRIHAQSLYNINTFISLESVPHITVESGTAVLELETLLPWITADDKIRTKLLPIKNGTGLIYLDQLRLNGRVSEYDNWTYDINGTCIDMNLDVGDTQNSVTGLAGTFHFTDQSFQMDQIKTRIFQTDFLSLSSKPSENEIINSMNLPFQIMNGRFLSKFGYSEFSGDIKFSENITLSIKTRKNHPEDTYTLQKLSLVDIGGITDMKIQANPEQTGFDFSGNLDSKTIKQIIKKGSLLYEKIFKITGGNTFTVEFGLRDQLKITIESMDIPLFLNETSSAGLSKDILKGKTILLDIDTLTIKKLKFNQFKARIIEKNQQIVIHVSNADWCSLETKGIVTVSSDHVICDLKITEPRDSELNRTLLCLFNQPNLIVGPYTLKGQIKADGTMAEFSRTFQGNLIFDAPDGRIYRLTLLSRILSFLNVSKLFKGKLPDIGQQGFAYHKIAIKANILNNRIDLEHAVIDGNDMTLVFTGWIDPVENQLDLTCLVAPFKTIDMIISKIPIVSTILNDRLISVPVKAKGPIDDPVITPLHPSSIGEGLVNIMVNILKTPVTLIEENL